jgi:hypothetical protein
MAHVCVEEFRNCLNECSEFGTVRIYFGIILILD